MVQMKAYNASDEKQRSYRQKRIDPRQVSRFFFREEKRFVRLQQAAVNWSHEDGTFKKNRNTNDILG
jgi:hypothetical protein